MNERQEYRVGVGASSILMIFVVLCMTTLGILSFSSARADLALTTRRQQYVVAYTAAMAQAEALFAEVDAALYAARAQAGTSAEAEAAFAALVQEIVLPDVEVTVSEDGEIAFEVPFGDTLVLDVAVRANPLGVAARYETVRYEIHNIGPWEPDDSLSLFEP